jgi:signal transduction histidine kinase
MLRWEPMVYDPEERRATRQARKAERYARRARHLMGALEKGWKEGPSPLTAEEKAQRDAKKAADMVVGLFMHAIAYVSVCLFLVVVAGLWPAMIVALAWGIGLAPHAFQVLVVPRLHTEIVQREVRARLTGATQQQRRDLESEQARRVQRLSASLAHEIRNPITAAKSLVQQMGEDPNAADNVNYANVALAELERVERSIAHLLRFAREEELSLAEIRIGDVVSSGLETLRDRTRDLGVKIETDLSAAGALRGDAEQLRRVVINLVSNALDAFRDAKTAQPALAISAGENLAGTEVWLRVRDNGPGIKSEHLGKLFDPFFTAKEGGTGLGLALSKKIVDAHGGTLDVSSELGRGTEFVVTLPKGAGAAS